MKTVVYYFSGTGNSLAVARDIARGLGAALVPMAGGAPGPGADRIGLVFPAYQAQLHGVPLIVERFLPKLDLARAPYIFAVCTCGGLENFNALPALEVLAGRIRRLGGKLSAEFAIRLPMNTLDYRHIPVPIDQDQDRMFAACGRRVGEICRIVAANGRSRFKAAKALLNLLMAPLYLLLRHVYYQSLRQNAREPGNRLLGFRDLVPLSDRSIYVDDNCKGCSTCSKVCPAANILMVEGRPTWQHHCEMCLACTEWCPSRALHHPSRAPGKFYRHPSVTLQDMLEQSQGRPERAGGYSAGSSESSTMRDIV